jgi:hypothetical protein
MAAHAALIRKGEEHMKRRGLFLVLMLLCAGIIFMSCSGKKTAAEDKDYLSMTWEQIIAEAKAEGSLVFYTWWGEEHWIEAGKEFEQQYGIKTTIIIGDAAANANKVIAEGRQQTGTIDAIMVGGDYLKPIMDLGLFYTPITRVLPNVSRLDPKLLDYVEGIKNNGELIPPCTGTRPDSSIIPPVFPTLPRPGSSLLPGSGPIPKDLDLTILPREAQANPLSRPPSENSPAALINTGGIPKRFPQKWKAGPEYGTG